MSEKSIQKVEKSDIQAPLIDAGGTAIVLQRHSKYERNRDSENSGSILAQDAELAIEQDVKFFKDLLNQEASDGVETMIMIVSSDTQYAGKGRRSMETAQLAQDAAVEVLMQHGYDPDERIINFNPNFSVDGFNPTGQRVRRMRGLVEPKIFDENPEFVRELGRTFNPIELQEEIDARRTDVQLSSQAFGAYEADEPEVKALREKHGAEGVHDILDRTKKSIKVLKRYAEIFHKTNPNKRLVIWAASHYDTISPLVKDATGTEFSEYVPVDYGGGVVIELAPDGGEAVLEAQSAKVALPLGKTGVSSSSS